jgi:hypothetical protein
MSSSSDFGAPLAVAALMEGFGRPWCIAGGWAIDLFLGRQTRPHKDVEIAIFRDDQHPLFEHLAGWTINKSTHPGRAPWHGERLELPIHELHARRVDDHIEVLMNERDGELWRYRRNLAVRLPVERLIRRSVVGIPGLTPEVALLYKSKGAPRPEDAADFANTLAALDTLRRQWLADALHTCDPDNQWLAQIERDAAT